MNAGIQNTGTGNSGDSNNGDWNSGSGNTGDYNSGDTNWGDRNQASYQHANDTEITEGTPLPEEDESKIALLQLLNSRALPPVLQG